MLAGLVLLHAGIDRTLDLTGFGGSMITTNLAFVSGRWLRGRSATIGSNDHTRGPESFSWRKRLPSLLFLAPSLFLALGPPSLFLGPAAQPFNSGRKSNGRVVPPVSLHFLPPCRNPVTAGDGHPGRPREGRNRQTAECFVTA
jgi:hypothetical protein